MKTPNLTMDNCPAHPELAAVVRRCSEPVAREWSQVAAGAGEPEQVVANIASCLEQGRRPEGATRAERLPDARHILWAYSMLRQILLRQVANQLGRPLQTEEAITLGRAVDCEMSWWIGQAVDRCLAELRVGGEAQAKYLSFLSHDLRGSLNGVVLMLEVLRRELKDRPEFAESLEDIGLMRKSILDTVGVMDRHVYLDRLRRGRLEVKVEDVEVEPVVGGVVREMAEAARAKGVAVKVQVPAEAKVRADGKLLTAAVRELLDNAIKYGSRGEVRIGYGTEVRDGKGVVVIEVSDSGPGMEPERLAKLADPIQRLELKERGLGLGIVYQVCRVCGGRMEAESKVGVGTRVKLVLPPPEG